MADERALISARPHFLLLPYVQQGHINPMLSLASQLAALGCNVTFVRAEKHGNSACLKELEGCKGVTFVSLEANNQLVCSSSTGETRKLEVCKSALAGLEDRMQAVASVVVESFRASVNPISFIISDFFMWKWVADLARKKAVQAAVLWTASALSFHTLFLEHITKEAAKVEEMLVLRLGLPSKEEPAARFGLLGRRDTPDMRRQVREFLHGLLAGIQEAGLHILVNSCEALEGSIVERFKPLVEEYCGENLSPSLSLIGPCLPAGSIYRKSDTPYIESSKQVGDNTVAEGSACVVWLDDQLIHKAGERSVLYISLIGSEEGMDLPHGQVEEIAAGLEDSGYSFLWVARPDAPAGSRAPEAFKERTEKSGKGRFVAWAPQATVLQHAAVGGFLTHSGWNSTLESLCAGVPMLCLPFLGDQPLNACLVHTHLQAGLRLRFDDAQGLVPRAEVKRGIQAIMESGGCLANNASQLCHPLLLAIQDAPWRLASSLNVHIADS